MFIQQTPQGDWTALIDAGPGQGRYSSVFALIPGIASSFLLFFVRPHELCWAIARFCFSGSWLPRCKLLRTGVPMARSLQFYVRHFRDFTLFVQSILGVVCVVQFTQERKGQGQYSSGRPSSAEAPKVSGLVMSACEWWGTPRKGTGFFNAPQSCYNLFRALAQNATTRRPLRPDNAGQLLLCFPHGEK